MNRSSLRKSFLDDLLGDADSPPSGGPSFTTSPSNAPLSSDPSRQGSAGGQQQQQRTKSVRFQDGDDSDDILGSLLPIPSTASTPSSSGATSLRVTHDPLSGQGSKAFPSASPTSRPASSPQHAPPARKQETGVRGDSAPASRSSSDWLGLSEESDSKSDMIRNLNQERLPNPQPSFDASSQNRRRM